MVGLAAYTQAAEACPDEATRTGQSAGLPDCRAYELVTPTDKSSSSQDMDHSSTYAIAAASGDSVALQSLVTLGPTPQLGGSFSVISRTALGWMPSSVKPEGSGSAVYSPNIFSPDLTQVGVESQTQYPFSPNNTFQVGVPGGLTGTVAATPREDENKHLKGDRLLGASADLSHVVFGSTDHILLSTTPTGTDNEAYDLYEWVDGQLRLVNLSNTGSVIGKCGATLGGGFSAGLSGHSFGNFFVQNAVSADGTKIFFTTPDPEGEGVGCTVASHLYMRTTEMVGIREEAKTVEISEPEGVKLSPAEEEMHVYYQDASVEGSKVFFLTERVLIPGATAEDEHLYEYDTEAPEGMRLTLIFQAENRFKEKEENETKEKTVFPSEDGAVVYFYRNDYTDLYRYEAAGGGSVHKITSLSFPANAGEAPYVTPNGESFVFASEGVPGEPRGAGHSEVYRYSHAGGSVICVSCGPGPGDAPANGDGFLFYKRIGLLEPVDGSPAPIPMSADGNQVFFDSSAALLPQVVNEGKTPEGGALVNVYEWEADGAGECTQSFGCTYLISRGNDQRESLLIGASTDATNVFFVTHAQLVPQDTDTLADIYDARVNGGFPAPAKPESCLGDTCQSVPPALTDPTPAWSSFSGAVNPVPLIGPGKLKTKATGCKKSKPSRRGRCVKRRRVRKAGRRAGAHNRGGHK